MRKLSRGATLLRTYLAASGRTRADVARAVDVSDVTVHHWLQSAIIRPRSERRNAIAEWTGGAVPPSSWDDDAAEADLALAGAGAMDAPPEPVEALHAATDAAPTRGAA